MGIEWKASVRSSPSARTVARRLSATDRRVVLSRCSRQEVFADRARKEPARRRRRGESRWRDPRGAPILAMVQGSAGEGAFFELQRQRLKRPQFGTGIRPQIVRSRGAGIPTPSSLVAWAGVLVQNSAPSGNQSPHCARGDPRRAADEPTFIQKDRRGGLLKSVSGWRRVGNGLLRWCDVCRRPARSGHAQ